jgi:hypothetical protein
MRVSGILCGAALLYAAVGSSSVVAQPPSPSGATIPPATEVVDGSGNAWTMPSLTSPGNIIYENGSPTTGDGSHVLVLYYDGLMYAENTGGVWYRWTGSGWTYIGSGDPQSSASGTMIPPATEIVDGSGNVWTMPSLTSPGNIIYENGSPTTGDGSHVLVLYYGGSMYAENTGGLWYRWTGSGWTYIASGVPQPSTSGTTIPSATQIVDSSGNIWTMPRLTSPGNIIYLNGTPTTGDGDHVLVLYEQGTVYAENDGNVWYKWTGSGWLPISISPLPPDRDASANWQMAGMLSAGGIPNRTTVCATVKPRGSGLDDSTNINNAINACPAGQVVSLAAGTFTIAEGNYVLIDNGISLRGAGPGTTILTRTGGAVLGSYTPGSNPSPMIILGPMEYNNTQTATTLTADGEAAAYSVQVASAAGFSVGQIVMIDEASGAGWQPDRIWASAGYPQIWAAPDYRVVWQKHNPSYADVDDFSASQYPYQAGTAGCWFSNCDRVTVEIKRIAAISGNTISFDSPLTISYRVSHQAQLYYWQTPFTENAGVENMTVEHGDDDNIDFNWCAYCWANNVENTLWLDDGFGVNNSFRVQLEEFYNHEPVWPVPGGGGYNISLANGSSEILVENGISVLANKVIVERAAGAGSVVGYNYLDDGFISGTDAWVEIGLNGSHYVGSHHTLFEGNYAFNIDSDQTHGNSIYQTFFRNYASGFRAKFTDYLTDTVVNDISQQSTNGPLRAAGAHAYAYWFSFIGNVLGTADAMTGWVYNAIGALNDIPNQGIWMLGWMDIEPQGYDPNVAATATLDGNFDYVTNAVTWAASDTAHTLPNSLYLTQKPAFFNAGSGYTWPWVNPTGSPQLYTLPAKARYNAGTPFTQP